MPLPRSAARPPRDGALVARSLAGDQTAYGELVDRYGPLVRGIAVYAGAREDAEDVVQEVFLRAWSALSQLERPDRFGPWLTQIARNTGRTWSRRRRHRTDVERRAAASSGYGGESPQERTESRQTADLLHEALGRLGPEHRVVLCLHFLEGCSYRQIARCLNMPLATVRWRILHGMTRLRGLLPAELATPASSGALAGRRRLAVLGAIAAGRQVDAASAVAPLPPSWLASRRLVATGLALSAILHLALLELGPWDEQRRQALRFGNTPAAAPRFRGAAPHPWETSATPARRLPQPPSAPILPPPPEPVPSTADESAFALGTGPSDPLARKIQRSRTVLAEMAQLAQRDTVGRPELDLLRLRDLDRSGSHHGVVVVDPADRRNVRGFVHFPSRLVVHAWPFPYGASTVARIAEYMRMKTGIEARLYAGSEWGHERKDEWLEYPILFSAPGIGPFARRDWWSGHTHHPPELDDADLVRLERYLRGGGFLFIEGSPWYLREFAVAVRAALGGDGRMAPVPFDHAIYHSYYDFPGGFPGEWRRSTSDHPGWDAFIATRLDGPPWVGGASRSTSLWGVELDGELVAAFSPQSILSLQPPAAFTTYDRLYDSVSVQPQLPWLRAATNVVVYALTRDNSLARRRPPGFWESLAFRD